MKQCWYLRYMLKSCSSAKENVFFRFSYEILVLRDIDASDK